tara:strand:+ start:162 stop:488 length:327 start_codon:yes stop_codon:yes gene_type:complete
MAILKIESKNASSGCYAEVFVARYEVYPNVDPTGVCVGFRTVCTPNGLSGYWDTVVPNADIPSGSTPTEVAALGWTSLSGTIVPWAETEMNKSTIIGDEFAKIVEEGA